MKIQFNNLGFFLLILVSGMFTFNSCTTDEWAEHYNVNKGIVSEKTLWETIKTNPGLKKFAWALKTTGYDQVLSTSQMYTVWAPADSVLVSFDTTQVHPDTASIKAMFVENHISRFSNNASENTNSKITLLNNKIVKFGRTGSDFYFGQSKLSQRNTATANGILHILNQNEPFFYNVWEYFTKEQRFDSIQNYLYSFNKLFFNESASIPGEVNEQGQTVYLDSVTFTYNKMFYIMGQMNNEDSSYTAIIPTNTAWNKSYANVKEYYRYFSTPATKYTADTLQRSRTMYSMVKDLVFSNKMQHAPNDSLITNTRSVFHNPQYLFEGAQVQTASNGTVYITDELKYKHWESWSPKIIVEAEQSVGRKPYLCTLQERYFKSDKLPPLSSNRFLEVSPLTPSSPNVTFDIPNTLSGKLNLADSTIVSGAAYNVYVVFAPSTVRFETPKPCKVSFVLTYTDEKGVSKNFSYNNKGQNFTTSADAISKVLVASKVTFPFCEYGLETPTVKLKVISNALASETTKFYRELFIDCIILEPVH